MQFISTDYVSTFTNGSLGLKTNISFSLFPKDFIGVIFYSVDNNNNRVQVKVKNDNKSSKAIRISYNDDYTDNLLNGTCGCDPCNNQYVNISIILNKETLTVSCNGHKPPRAIFNQNTKRNKSEHIVQPMLASNAPNLTYIMLGNFEPYNDSRGNCIYPDKVQLLACVFYFKINHFHVSNNKQIGTKVQSRCIKQCVTKDICNEGQCLETYTHLFCVCNNTSLNGPQCNNSLKTYNKGVNTSYMIKKVEKPTYMKLTWRPSKGYSKEHCLFEFVSNDKYECIFIDKTMSDSFGNVTTNFANVNITNDSIDYKILNRKKSLKFPMPEKSRINIGFSERSGVCETFNGEYDFIYDTLNLRSIDLIISTHIAVSTNVSEYKPNKTDTASLASGTPDRTKKNGMTTIWIIVTILGITVVYAVMQTLWLIQRSLFSQSKDVVSPASELIEIDEEEYSETDNPDSLVNGNGAYSSEQYTYSTYKKLPYYTVNDVGPQLPPRDEERNVWIGIDTGYDSIEPTSENNLEHKVEYQMTYSTVEDNEYAKVDK